MPHAKEPSVLPCYAPSPGVEYIGSRPHVTAPRLVAGATCLLAKFLCQHGSLGDKQVVDTA